MYLIQYEMIMMLIGYTSHILKIDTITRGIIFHTSNTIFLNLYIPLYRIHLLNAIRITNSLNFSLIIWVKINCQFKRNQNLIVRKIVLNHPTHHLCVWNEVNARENHANFKNISSWLTQVYFKKVTYLYASTSSIFEWWSHKRYH